MEINFVMIVGALSTGLALGAAFCFLFYKRQLAAQVELVKTPLISQIELLQEKATFMSNANSELTDQNTNQAEQLQSTQIALTRLEERFDEQHKTATKLQETLEQGQTHKESLQTELANRQAQLAETQNQLENERQQANEKLELLQNAKEDLSNQFKVLAQTILEEKSEKFTKQNQEQLDDILKPFKTQLTDFRKRVDDVYDKESKDRVSLHTEILNLQKATLQIGTDAINLTNALKGDSKTQGNWGELVLERLLEESGLREGHEYHREVSINTEGGKRFRPDVVINLPHEKDVVIDSKVSLTAYEAYNSAQTEDEKAKALRSHIQSLRNHIKNLSSKNYEQLPGLRTLDYVLLFVPIEPAFLVAVQEDRNIFLDAYSKNIMLVSPTTLLLTLRTIEAIWRNEKQNRNSLEIARQAGNLYDKFVSFSETLLDIGDKLDKARGSYEKATSQLSSGRGNLIARTEGLKKLGIKSKKALPESLQPEPNLLALASKADLPSSARPS